MTLRAALSKFHVLSSKLLALGFLLSLPFVTARIYASDEVEGFAWLHSLFFDHDVSFENEYEYFYTSGQVKNPGFHETFLEDRRTETGLRPNFTTMGAALLWAPFYGAGHVAALAGGGRPDGLSPPYITAVAVGSAIYGLLALLLAIDAARRLTTGGVAAGAAVWLGTPLLFYMYVTPIFTHACSAFAVALFLWAWLRVRDRWTPGGAFALGLAGGLMTIVRAQDALFLVGPALDLLRALWRRPPVPRLAWWRRSLAVAAAGTRPAVTWALGFALLVAPQLWAFKVLNGHFRQSEFETRKMSWTSPHFWQVLADDQHGLFFWSPLALLAFVGLARLAVRRPPRSVKVLTPDLRWIGVVAMLVFLLQAYIAGAVESWTVAGAFGQRRFVSLTPLLVVGVAAFADGLTPVRSWIRGAGVALIGLGVWWNLGLMAQFGLHTMDRERLHPAENARQSFIVLPARLPALVWQYLTDRTSFYNRPQQ